MQTNGHKGKQSFRELLMTSVKIYKKGEKIKLSKNFRSDEFDCNCKNPECKITKIDMNLVKLLQEVRDKIKRPLIIEHGFRCKDYNKAVGGSETSLHLEGKAADLVAAGMKPLELKEHFNKANGLGLYNTILHVDIRDDSENQIFWDFRTKK
jgi:uncharacterized protein YcbK (DUF882 family)